MDKNVFISKIEIYEIQRPVKTSANKKQLSIYIFDKNGEETIMSTSIMSPEDIEKYKRNLLNALNSHSWLQAIYSANPVNLTTILDSEDSNRIIGLESDYGLILKNEIKIY